MSPIGYPMSFQRLLRRNGLAQGDYGDDPAPKVVTTTALPGREAFNDDVDMEQVLSSHIAHLREEIERLYAARSMLLGDLRRLEHDAVDERAVCTIIATRTAIDPEVVAAVLKEFIGW